MEYVIYTYGGFAEMIATIFNAMARLFATDSEYFTVVGKMSLTVGAIWAGTRAIFNTNIGIFGKHWFFPAFLSFTFLFAPKATVHIHDDATRQAYTVANVPFVVAFFSSVPSKLSHYLAEQIEEQMSTPDAIRSSHHGVMFGAKLISKVKDVKVKDQTLLDNAKNFSKQCFLRPWIMGNILGKREEAETTKDIVTFLKNNKANNFGIYYKEKNGNISFKSCPEVTDMILNDLDKEAKSSRVLASIDSSLGRKDITLDQLARRMTETGTGALQSLSQATSDFHQWVRQSMMLNVYRESLDDWRESANYQRLYPDLVSMNATRGMFQQSLGWLISGEMAAQMLPLLQMIVFLMAACSIFVVFPLVLFPGGYEILKVWLKSLIWVHTWPVFFAIINCIGMAVLSTRLGSFGEDYGMDKLSQGAFSDTLIHTYAIVQMFAALVPVFSWALLNKGGYAFSNMVERFSPMGVGAGMGAHLADGNLSLDNQSISGRSINQQNVGSSLNSGHIYDTGGVRVTQSEDGREFIQQSVSSMATNYRGSAMESAALTDSYNEQSSKMNALNDRSSTLASLEKTQMQDYAKRWLSSHDASDVANERIANAMRVVSSGGINTAEGFSERQGKGTDTHTDMSAGLKAPIFGGVSTGSAARNSQDVSHDQSAQQTQQYSEALDQVRDYAKTHDIREGVGTSDTLSQNIQDTWREQEQISQDKSQTLQNMESLSKQQAYVQQHQSSIDHNWNDRVLDEVAARHGLSSKQEALSHLDANQDEGASILRELVGQKYAREIPDAVANKGDELKKDVQKHVVNQPTYDQSKEKLYEQYQKSIDHADQTAFQNKVTSALEASEKQALADKAQQSADEFSKTMEKEGIGGKVKVTTDSDKMKEALAHQKGQFDNVSNSTAVRAFNRGAKNIDNVGKGALDKGSYLIDKGLEALKKSSEVKDKYDKETNPFDSAYKPNKK